MDAHIKHILQALIDDKEIEYLDIWDSDKGWSVIPPFMVMNYLQHSRFKLRVKPKAQLAWIALYNDSTTSKQYHLREDCLKFTPKEGRIACIQVKYTPGEGL